MNTNVVTLGLICLLGCSNQRTKRVESISDESTKNPRGGVQQFQIDDGPVDLSKVDSLKGAVLLECLSGEELIRFGNMKFDCNDNGIADGEEIDQGLVDDKNANGIPDSCEVQK